MIDNVRRKELHDVVTYHEKYPDSHGSKYDVQQTKSGRKLFCNSAIFIKEWFVRDKSTQETFSVYRERRVVYYMGERFENTVWDECIL